MQTLLNPTVYLVGAGPGDPELITLKGLKRLQQAKVLLYDALVHPDLLNHAPKSALKIPVGKRYRGIKTSQDHINELMVRMAFQHGEVVRLKGGDPNVFARGVEEAEHLSSFGIRVEVVPGLSTATALASAAQVPLTYRNLSRSFWVVTATGSDGQLTEDFRLAAQSSATVVVLMGLHKAAEIQDDYLNLGKGDLPFCVIQEGTTRQEKRVYGLVQDLVATLEEEAIASPAVMIIGRSVQQAIEFAHLRAEPPSRVAV